MCYHAQFRQSLVETDEEYNQCPAQNQIYSGSALTSSDMILSMLLVTNIFVPLMRTCFDEVMISVEEGQPLVGGF
jgi:hypothetical protein